jgi:hypothetical protein
MEQKPAQELLDRQSQQALLVSVGGVSPAKGDLVTGQRPEAMVGEGDPMGIGTQIVEDIVGASEGGLAVDDPVLAEQGTQERGESLGWGELLERAMETELALGKGWL